MMLDNNDITQEFLSNDYVGIYLDKMEKLVEENIDFLRDPQAISHAFNLSFELIYDSFKDNIKKKRNLCFNDLLYEASQEENPLLSCDFEFIKYIHIFNFAKDRENGAVNMGIDFVNQKILDDCTSMEEGNSLFRKDTLAIMYNLTSGFWGNNIIEYCHEPYGLVLDSRSYSTITSKSDDNNNRNYHFCDLFKYLLRNDENIKIGKAWFDRFEENNTQCIDNTNFFFIQSNSGEGDLFDDNWEYVLYANIGIDSTKANNECINVFLQKFTQFLDRISIVILLSIKEDRTRQQIVKGARDIRQIATRGAIALVMARNMSHNIGSHVLGNLISHNVYDKVSDSAVLQCNIYQPYFGDKSVNKTTGVNKNPQNFQLAYFNQYLKNRMDYLSEVAFGIPNMLATKYMLNDVLKELDRVRILLNYISGIPEFKYTLCLKYNGTPLTDTNDIAVAFPSDVLGNQAFYNIIENIIRNTAKHAYNGKQEANIFTIEFSDVKDSFEYYCVEIDNGVEEKDIEKLVDSQNALIAESIIDENDKNYDLRGHGLGILEMKASAAFLRQINIAKVDEVYDKRSNYPLLKAINKSHSLGYQFFLQKPKEFLLVGNWREIADSKKKEFDSLGIQFISLKKFYNSLKKGTSYAHQFILYKDNETKRIIKNCFVKYDTLLPLRRLGLPINGVEAVIKILNNNEVKDIVNNLKEFSWNQYFQDILFAELKNCNNHNFLIRIAADFEIQENGYSSNQVIFLHHSDRNTHGDTWTDAQKHKDCEAWIENLSSKTSTKLPEFNKYSDGVDIGDYCDSIRLRNMKENRIRYSIFEAYHNRVIALDERIQKFSRESFEGSDKKESGGLIPCSELFKSTNVLIPERPLDSKSFTEEFKTEFESYVDENLKGAFLLVHYGILERLYKNETVITDKLNEWAKKAKRVVVTSGRGAHSLPLPQSVCFADLSSVLYAFVENRNKITINDLLNQSRRKYE